MTTATLAPLRPEQWSHLTTLLTQAGLPLDGLSDHQDATLVALDGNTVMGSVALEITSAVALLRSLAVAPDCQGQGIGACLFDALVLAVGRARDSHALSAHQDGRALFRAPQHPSLPTRPPMRDSSYKIAIRPNEFDRFQGEMTYELASTRPQRRTRRRP